MSESRLRDTDATVGVVFKKTCASCGATWTEDTLWCSECKKTTPRASASGFSDVRCTICGGSRLLKNGRPEVCSFIECKDPTFDVEVERAKAALWRLFGFATSEARPNEAGEEQCARDRALVEKLIGVGGPRRRT